MVADCTPPDGGDTSYAADPGGGYSESPPLDVPIWDHPLSRLDDDEDDEEEEDKDNNEYFRGDFVVEDGVEKEEDKASMPCCCKNNDVEYSDEDEDGNELKVRKR